MCILSQQVNVDVTASRASLALELGSSSTVARGKRPHEASTDEASQERADWVIVKE